MPSADPVFDLLYAAVEAALVNAPPDMRGSPVQVACSLIAIGAVLTPKADRANVLACQFPQTGLDEEAAIAEVRRVYAVTRCRDASTGSAA